MPKMHQSTFCDRAAPGPAVGLCAPHTPYPQWGLRPDPLWGYALRTLPIRNGAAPGPAVGLCAPHTPIRNGGRTRYGVMRSAHPLSAMGAGLLLKKGEESK